MKRIIVESARAKYRMTNTKSVSRSVTVSGSSEGFNLSGIMSAAWAIRRRAAEEMGCTVSEVLFSECLRMAWHQARNVSIRVLHAWQALTGEQQAAWLRACVRRAAKDEIAYSVEDRYLQYAETVAWFLRNHDLDEFVSEAWLKVESCMTLEYLEARNAKRAASGKLNVTLNALVYAACVHAINRVWREDVKHGRARLRTIRDKSGNEYSYIDTMATNRRDNTEAQAIGAVVFEEFVNGRDEIDRLLIDGIRDGFKLKEVAAFAGVSAPAITKRLKKLRAALIEAGLAPTWMAA